MPTRCGNAACGRLCGLVSARFVCGQEDRDIHGAIVVVLNAGGNAFLAHNMVLLDDNQWTSELVGFPSDRRPLKGHVHLRSCATLALVMDLHLAAPSPSLPFTLRQDRQVGLLLPPQDQHLAVLSARAHAVEMKASLNELNEGQSQVVASFFRTDSGPLNVLINEVAGTGINHQHFATSGVTR